MNSELALGIAYRYHNDHLPYLVNPENDGIVLDEQLPVSTISIDPRVSVLGNGEEGFLKTRWHLQSGPPNEELSQALAMCERCAHIYRPNHAMPGSSV